MKIYDDKTSMPDVAADRLRIARFGSWDGRDPLDRYALRCQAWHAPSGTSLTLTRDRDMPVYEGDAETFQCYHLSLSFSEPHRFGVIRPRDLPLTCQWVNLIYRADVDRVVCEPPTSAKGKREHTWHYFLFTNEYWNPADPTPEMMATGLTPWPEIRAEFEAAEQARRARESAESIMRAIDRRRQERQSEL